MAGAVEQVRAFNRSWAEVLGLLDRSLLDSGHTPTQARVLLELGPARGGVERIALRDRLGIDQSFLGRVLAGLQRRDLIEVARDKRVGRRYRLTLTPAGRQAYRMLERRSVAQVGELVAHLTPEQLENLVESLTVARSLIQAGPQPAGDVVFRNLEAGDLGWIVERNGAIYADEFGWNAGFEAFVARIVADYQEQFRPGRDQGWMATVDGARAGSVFCVERDEVTAQLRMLLVEPWARGHGIGTRLVETCIAFARSAGYQQMMLWTNNLLTSARRIYEAAGFELEEEDERRDFGHALVVQSWRLDLVDG